jgi:hypothetical protein
MEILLVEECLELQCCLRPAGASHHLSKAHVLRNAT